MISLIISLCALLGLYWISQVLGKDMNLYYVTTKTYDIDAGTFMVQQVEDIAEKENYAEEDGLKYTYTYEQVAKVKTMNHTLPMAHIVVTNQDYSKIYDTQLKAGSFLNEAYSRQAVVDEEISFSLFGSEDIIGQSLEIDGQIFYIVGIAKTTKDRPQGSVYIQAKDFKGYETCKVKGIMFSKGNAGAVESKNEIYRFLSKFNLKREQTNVIEVNHYKVQIRKRWQFLLKTYGIIFFLEGINICIRYIKLEINKLRDHLKIEYVGTYLRKNGWYILGKWTVILAMFIINLGVMIILSRQLSLDIIQQNEMLGSIYNVPSWLEQLRQINYIAWWIYIVGMLAGLICWRVYQKETYCEIS